MTSACIGLTAEQKAAQPEAGSLFEVTGLGVRGVPTVPFNTATYKIRSLVRAHALCGEGPCYDPARGVLLWVDAFGKLLCEYNPSTRVNRATQFGGIVSAANPTTDGRIILCVGLDIIIFDPKVNTENYSSLP